MPTRSGRRSRAETAALVREAAVRLLRRDGLQGFANSVRLDDALRLLHEEQGIRLTHGSLYGRIWVDQRDFQLDVVATALGRYDGSEIAEAITAAVQANPAITPARALGAAAAAARVSRPWNLWLGAHTAVVTTPDPDDDDRLEAALGQAREAVRANVAEALVPIVGSHASALASGFLTLLIGVSFSSSESDAAWLQPALAAVSDVVSGAAVAGDAAP